MLAVFDHLPETFLLFAGWGDLNRCVKFRHTCYASVLIFLIAFLWSKTCLLEISLRAWASPCLNSRPIRWSRNFTQIRPLRSIWNGPRHLQTNLRVVDRPRVAVARCFIPLQVFRLFPYRLQLRVYQLVDLVFWLSIAVKTRVSLL
jgi:hypothetical protein